MVRSTDEKEQDLLNILMESNLYLELTMDERYLLLQRIVEFYRSLNICMASE